MKVRDLIAQLKEQDPDASVILHVYGHTYHCVNDKRSHGAAVVHAYEGANRVYDVDYNVPPGVVIRASSFPLIKTADRPRCKRCNIALLKTDWSRKGFCWPCDKGRQV